MAIPVQAARPVDVNAEAQRELALELRIGGASYRKIAKAINCSVASAYRYVTDALADLRERNAEAAEEVRQVEIARLDEMMLKLWPNRGEPRYADSILRVMERRANLLGLDAPKDFRIAHGGANAVPVTGDLDVAKLSTDELRELEQIQVAYDALVARQAVRLPAGTPVAVVPAPPEEGIHDPASD